MSRDRAPEGPPLAELFFRGPAKAQHDISPDGRHLSWIGIDGGRRAVVIRPRATGADRVLGAPGGADVLRYVWAGSRHVVMEADPRADGQTSLWVCGVPDGRPERLTPAGQLAEILASPGPRSEEVLFLTPSASGEDFDVFRADVRTGRSVIAAKNPGGITTWIADARGRVRAGARSDGLATALLVRDDEQASFRVLATASFPDTLMPLAFTEHARREGLLVTTDVGRPRQAIVELDLGTGAHARVWFEHGEVDVSEAIVSRARRDLVGVRYETWRPSQVCFDVERQAWQRRLERRFPGKVVIVGATSEDEKWAVAWIQDGKTPGETFLYDTAGDHAESLGAACPWLDPRRLAETMPVTYRARDGLLLHGLVTCPSGVDPFRLPLVVLPHGGPWDRDRWGYAPEAQLFASRGYAVLRPGFRGSIGYGKAFCSAGFGRWGREMQDDISEGVRFLIASGIADPRRVAIVGHSYGGYAALAGLALTPELYACGASIAGLTDIAAWLEGFPAAWAPYREMMFRMVGDPTRDRALLDAVSPLRIADRFQAPVLLIHGKNDPRAPFAQSEALAARLSALGKEVTFVPIEDEGHDLAREGTESAIYDVVDRFLAQHL